MSDRLAGVRPATTVRSVSKPKRLLPAPFRMVLVTLAAMIPLVIVAVLLFLIVYAWPAIKFNGLAFLYTKTWNLGNLYPDPVLPRGVQAPIGAA